MLASRHGNFPVKKGDKIVGMRVDSASVEEEKMNHVKELCGEEPIFTNSSVPSDESRNRDNRKRSLSWKDHR